MGLRLRGICGRWSLRLECAAWSEGGREDVVMVLLMVGFASAIAGVVALHGGDWTVATDLLS